jgi:F5/8 type C domain-containing protein/polysaccharide lyase-like protein
MKTGAACFLVLSMAAGAHAAVLWDGDASNGIGVWGSIQVPNGSVTVVDDATYGKAFKIVCNDNGGTKARAEVARFKNFPLQDNADYYIGWSSKWGPLPTLSGKWQVLSQVHLDGPGSVGGPVPFGLSVPGDGQMHFNLQSPTGSSASMWNHSLPLNSWHRYVMHTKVGTSLSTGFCELWYDGVMQTLTNGQTRIPCAMDHDDAGYYWKWGVYRSGSGGPIGQSVHYLARVRLASNLADALPAPPGGGTTPTPTPVPTLTPTPIPTVTPTPTNTPIPADDIEVTPPASAVTASANDGNLPGNTVDNNLGTRWSADGDGQWLKLDLSSTRTVTRVGIAVYNGHTRANRFDLQVSTDNVTWTNVLTGASSTGTTTAEAVYEFADQPARWVRYLGHGSSDPTKATMNSVTEVSVYALAAVVTPTPTPLPTETPTPTPTATPAPAYVEVTPGGSAVTASSNDGNVPANTVDDNLATRWSGNGDGQWLQVDLGTTRTVGYVGIAVYNGNSRRNKFDLQTSADGTTWTTHLTAAETSGTTTAEEPHDIPDTPARYVRYVGHMSNVGTFNSVTEISVFAAP